MLKRCRDVWQREIGVHDGFVDHISVLGVQLRQAGYTIDHVRHLQCSQRIDLAKAECLTCIERLEEDRTETVVRIGFATQGLSTKLLVPDRLTATPQRIAVFELEALRKLRALHELADAFAIIAKTHALVHIGHSLDVIGL